MVADSVGLALMVVLEMLAPAEAVAEPRKTAKTVAIKNLDFGDLKPVWNKMLDSNRPDAETGLLKVTARVGSLDPLAQQALAKMRKKFPYTSSNLDVLVPQRMQDQARRSVRDMGYVLEERSL